MNKPSKGEQKLIEIFNKNNINFKREISFEHLVGNKQVPLRFDFGLFKSGKLICLVEVDGPQHYKFIKYFHKNQSNFLKAKEWDRRKNKFCLLNKIPLIRIPYWDLDNLTLEKILTTKEYRVTSKYHNDYLINGGVK